MFCEKIEEISLAVGHINQPSIEGLLPQMLLGLAEALIAFDPTHGFALAFLKGPCPVSAVEDP